MPRCSSLVVGGPFARKASLLPPSPASPVVALPSPTLASPPSALPGFVESLLQAAKPSATVAKIVSDVRGEVPLPHMKTSPPWEGRYRARNTVVQNFDIAWSRVSHLPVGPTRERAVVPRRRPFHRDPQMRAVA